MEPINLTVACPDTATARAIAQAAVEARLAACGNILSSVASVFRWDNAVEEAAEVLLVLKSRSELADALVTLIGGKHPYDLPAITWETSSADRATTDWILRETAG